LLKPELKQIYNLGKGDICNSFYFTASNHTGTHVDAPARPHIVLQDGGTGVFPN